MKGHFRKKTIIRSSIVFTLIITLFLSMFSIASADASIPDGLYTLEDVLPSQSAIDWVADMLEQDSNSYVCIYIRTDTTINISTFFVYVIQADVAVYFDITNQNIATSSRYGMAGIVFTSNNYNYGSVTNQLPGNNSFYMDGTQYWYFNGLNSNSYQPKEFYCSIEFKDNGGDVDPNLDISDFLPAPYYLEANLSEDKEFIWVDVNFNVDVFPSMVSLWGYNDYGATPYNYVRDEYIGVQFDMGTDGIHSIFKIPLAPFRAQYLGQDFTIQSISVIGWDEVGHEEWLSLGWHLSDLTPGDYNPPINNYYNNYVYNSDYYTNLDRSVVSFGNVKIRLYSSNVLGNVFWDEQKTTVTPFKYSYIFFPQLNYYDESYYDLINQLCLEFDLVFINCPAALVDSMYGSGTTQNINQIAHQNSVILEYITTLTRNYGRLSYGENIPYENYTEYTCCCLYTDSFYLKNLAYFFGDNNNILLEIETRLFSEDGEFSVLFDNMKDLYDNDFDYYSKMITYMDKLNYLVYVVTNIDYFNNVLQYLRDISEKDFTIDLPQFDFSTVIGKYPNSSISNLTDFISDSVYSLPTWDFSSLSSFKGSIATLFISVAPDGEFIENISEPYSFGDSVENDLFPD